MRKRRKSHSSGELATLALPLGIVFGFMAWHYTKRPEIGVFIGTMLSGITLLIAMYQWLNYREKIVNSGIAEIDRMDGQRFEVFLQEFLRRKGFRVRLTPVTADYGADLVLEKNGVRLVVQAKRWQGTVGIEAVQQVIGAIKHYQAQKGLVITNSYFSDNAKKLALSNQVLLWDRDKLIELLLVNKGKSFVQSSLQPTKATAAPAKRTAAEKGIPSGPRCLKCGKPMIVRVGPQGKFWGCSGYPKCKNTMHMHQQS